MTMGIPVISDREILFRGIDMREIKFRAWLKETKEMIPVYQIDFNNGIINSESAWRMESEYILEQFTGLHDNPELLGGK